jgi:hypothetical protein
MPTQIRGQTMLSPASNKRKDAMNRMRLGQATVYDRHKLSWGISCSQASHKPYPTIVSFLVLECYTVKFGR